jgi:hypothetical protein
MDFVQVKFPRSGDFRVKRSFRWALPNCKKSLLKVVFSDWSKRRSDIQSMREIQHRGDRGAIGMKVGTLKS